MNHRSSFITAVVVVTFALDAETTAADVCARCECDGHGLVHCENYDRAPFPLPDNATAVRFVNVRPAEYVFGDGALSSTTAASRLLSVVWTASHVASVTALRSFYRLTRLDLSGNAISAVADGAFDRCPYLEYVDLSDNRLTALPDALFANAGRLHTVRMQGNAFRAITAGLFEGCGDSMTELSLGNRDLQDIAANAMTGLTGLRVLSVENSAIERIDKSSFGRHPRLDTLRLNNCTRLETIDDDFITSSAPNVETIELNDCGTIGFLPPGIVSLKNLKRLQMSGTNIRPNCRNGWFGRWLNDNADAAVVVVGFQNRTDFVEAINRLECPPKIHRISSTVMLQLTKSGTVDCMAFGNPSPAITWLVPGGLTFHENKEADANITQHPKAHDWDLNPIDNNQLHFTERNGSLHITRMLRSNIGNYTCYVSNKYGNDSRTAEVLLDSEVFFNIKINALLLGITSALGFLMLTILCCAFKLLLIRLVY